MAIATITTLTLAFKPPHPETKTLEIKDSSRIKTAESTQTKGIKVSKKKVAQKPATQPKPKPTPVVNLPGNCSQYRPLVAEYAWNVSVAMNVMDAETAGGVNGMCDPGAANWTDNHIVCKGSFGLFQISCHHGQVYSVAENIRIAYEIKYKNQGWGAWEYTCTHKVRCY